MKTLEKILNFIISLADWIRGLYMNGYDCVTDVTETLITNVIKECDDHNKDLFVKTICAVLLIGVSCIIPLRLYLNYRLEVIRCVNGK